MITASLGRVSPRHKGEYNSSNIYTKLDIVSYLGSSYMVLKDTVGVTPVVGPNYQLVAEAGTSTAITNLTVSTGAPGTVATVTPGGTALQRTYALTVPRGDKGVDGSFIQKAYTTEALMIADRAEIPTDSSVMVTNDTAPSKNGLYAYNGTTFTKSAYDPLGQMKAFVEGNPAFKAGIITDNSSFDSYIKTGHYIRWADGYTNIANAPYYNNTVVVYGILEVKNVIDYNSRIIFQTYYPDEGLPVVTRRTDTNGVYGKWVEVFSRENQFKGTTIKAGQDILALEEGNYILSDFDKNLGLATLHPSDKTIKSVNPKSIPILKPVFGNSLTIVSTKRLT